MKTRTDINVERIVAEQPSYWHGAAMRTLIISSFVALALLASAIRVEAQTPPRLPLGLAELMGIPGLAPPGTLPSMGRGTAVPAPVRGRSSMAAPQQPPLIPLNPRELALMRERQASCFAAGRGEAEWEARAAAAVVQVIRITPEGVSIGSGIVIRNSNQIPGGTNAIITAMHVIDGAANGAPNTALGIIGTSGDPIGWAEVVARGHLTRGREGRWVHNVVERGDVAVLRIRGFAPNGERTFQRIEGVDVAPAMNTRVMQATVSTPAGTNPGISGAAALDPEGRTYGVVVRRSAETPTVGNWTVRGLRHQGTDPMRAPPASGPRASKTTVLPTSSTTYVEPLLHPEVLAALGGAASEVSVIDGGGQTVETLFMGFPGGVCVTYRGTFSATR